MNVPPTDPQNEHRPGILARIRKSHLNKVFTAVWLLSMGAGALVWLLEFIRNVRR